MQDEVEELTKILEEVKQVVIDTLLVISLVIIPTFIIIKYFL